MRKRTVALSLLMTLIMAVSLSAGEPDTCPVKLSQNTTVRKARVSITVANPPKVNEGIVQLRGPSSVDSSPLPLKNGTLEYTIPGDLPLGQYVVTVKIGDTPFCGCEFLRVTPAPNWDVKLLPFDPDTTYHIETVRVPDENDPQRGSELKTVRLALRGTGFLKETPEDNQIVINGRLQQVKWDNLANLPDTVTPTPNEIHGRVNYESIDLARIPVPPEGVIRVQVRQGDRITDPQHFTVYRWSKWPVAVASAVIALLLALVVLFLIYVYNRKKPKEFRYNALKVLFLDLETNTYSLSKFQFFCWTWAALFGYAYLVISKMLVQGLGWPDVPGSLPGIIAIGAGTAVGSQFATNIRGPKGAGPEEPGLGDFVASGGVAAVDRVQMLVWTLFGLGVFCLAVLQYTPGSIKDLDPVPTNMLYMMGLSGAGYLAGKFARKPGPVINEISITPTESDAALASASLPPPAAPPNLSQPVAKAQAVAQILTSVPTGAENAVSALSDGIAAALKAKTTADAGELVAKLAELRNQAEKAADSAAAFFEQAPSQSEAAHAAQAAQQAAAALQDFSTGVSSIVSVTLAPSAQGAPPAPVFTRVIELRGRNLSSEAQIEIDGAELPFRMLLKNPDGAQRPEVVIREQDDQTLARMLRLSIDPGQLEGPDFKQYKQWFGNSNGQKKTFTLINLDGQKSEISFTIAPAATQK
ncbi:MAG: hypothetical protein WAN11_19045 [Syntrophobacteraceae bacterium]